MKHPETMMIGIVAAKTSSATSFVVRSVVVSDEPSVKVDTLPDTGVPHTPPTILRLPVAYPVHDPNGTVVGLATQIVSVYLVHV